MTDPLTVVGDDVLAAYLDDLVPGPVHTAPALPTGPEADPEAATPLVVVRRHTGPPHDAVLHETSDATDRPLLPVRYEHDAVLVGPWIGPSTHPCLSCLARRRERALPDASRRRQIAHGLPRHLPRPLGDHPALRHTVAAVVAHHTATVAARAPQLTRVDPATLAVTSHRYLPDPLCTRCGNRPIDTAAAYTLRPRPKQDPGSWRQTPIGARADTLTSRFVDSECGIVRGLSQNAVTSLPLVSAPMGIGHLTELSSGRTLDFETSRLSALAESLERYAGIVPRGSRPVVRGTYEELADVAIDPTDLGLHDPAVYDQPDGKYRPYTPDTVCDWVWGHSFARNGPVLVPRSHAYYGERVEGDQRPDKPFVYEISSGCALGGSVEEALLHGLFEVAERDAFLMTWYARMPVPEIDLAGHRDPTVRVLTERIGRHTGMRVRAFDTTVDLLPAVWVIAVDEHDRDDRPKHVCGAGAHMDPDKALGTALLELSSILHTADTTYTDRVDEASRMVADPGLVVQMDDHLLAYAHPDAGDRLDFLLRPDARPAPSPHRPAPPPPAPDVTDDLRWALDTFLAADVDVVVVDQTTPELAGADLACVKAVAVGAIPMTFGHTLRRTRGLPRLLDVPAALGYLPRRLSHDDLNPHPHPFP
jgi:ribosomal protein S12 methylthiotransferase accessory factor